VVGVAQKADKNVLRHLGIQMRRRRVALGYTLKDVAARSKLSLRFVSDVEAGRGNISIGRLSCIAAALRTPVSELVREPYRKDLSIEIEMLLHGLPEEECRNLISLLGILGGRQPPQIIALLGMRGAGKTTVGEALADRLTLPFVELNERVEQQVGLELPALFEIYGYSRYREMEERCLAELVRQRQACVVALPGGVVANPNSLALIKASCLSVWLKATPEVHWDRLIGQGDLRPMAGKGDPMGDLRKLVQAREALYSQADFTLNTSELEVETVIELIMPRVEALHVNSNRSSVLPAV